MVGDFFVIQVEDEHAQKLKDALDSQFCTATNPLSGAYTLLIDAKPGYKFLLIPLVMKIAKPVKYLMKKGFKKAAESGGFSVQIVKVSDTGRKFGELKEQYEEYIKKKLF